MSFLTQFNVQGHYELTVHDKATLARSTFMLKVGTRIVFTLCCKKIDNSC